VQRCKLPQRKNNTFIPSSTLVSQTNESFSGAVEQLHRGQSWTLGPGSTESFSGICSTEIWATAEQSLLDTTDSETSKTHSVERLHWPVSLAGNARVTPKGANRQGKAVAESYTIHAHFYN
jgi:hypothetical protein